MELASDNCSSTSSSLTLRLNVVLTALGNAVYSGCQFGIFVVLAKLNLTEEAGRLAYALALTAPIFLFFQMQMRVLLASDATGEYAFSDYFMLRLETTSLAMLVTLALSMYVANSFQTLLIILGIGLSKYVEGLSDIFYGVAQAKERMDVISRSVAVRGMLFLLIICGSAYVSKTIVWGCLILPFGWAAVFFYHDKSCGKKLLGTDLPIFEMNAFRSSRLRELAALGLPLGLVMALAVLTSSTPRYYIQHFSGSVQLGIYASISYLAVAGRLLVGAIGNSATARLTLYWNLGNRRGFIILLIKMISFCWAIGVLGVAIAALAGKGLLRLLFNSDYSQYVDVMVWIMGGTIFAYMATTLGFALTVIRSLYVQAGTSILVLSVINLVCVLKVPVEGALGAAKAVFWGFVTQFTCFLIILVCRLRKA